MNKAKEVKLINGQMTKGNYKWEVGEVSYIPNEVFNSELQIVAVRWQNSGFYLALKDANGKEYFMNDTMFSDYIEKNKVTLTGDWTYYKQGTAQSIGLDS